MPFWLLHQKFDSPQCSRHGNHSVTCPDPSYSTDTLQTRKSLCYSYGSQSQLQFQIHSRHRSHSATHTNLNFRYSPDTLQTRLPLCHSFRICPQHAVAPYRYFSIIRIQYRYTPDTAVILIFILYSNTVTAQIRPRCGVHSFAHTNSVSRYSSNAFQTRIPF